MVVRWSLWKARHGTIRATIVGPEPSRRKGTVIPAGPIPRKQRTRQHVIADQSVNYVERFIIDQGHTTQRVTQDYGYDLILFTYDAAGYVEPGAAFIQLKGSETLAR